MRAIRDVHYAYLTEKRAVDAAIPCALRPLKTPTAFAAFESEIGKRHRDLRRSSGGSDDAGRGVEAEADQDLFDRIGGCDPGDNPCFAAASWIDAARDIP